MFLSSFTNQTVGDDIFKGEAVTGIGSLGCRDYQASKRNKVCIAETQV